MGMSNTAVPKYYAEYREQVRNGEIPVCEEIEMEMNRIDELIADPTVYYNDKIVEGWVRFCNRECTLTNGDDLDLLPIFKVWGEQLLGWYYYADRMVPEEYINAEGRKAVRRVHKKVKLRLINKQYLIVARGAAKSMYASLMQNYFLNCDPATTHQIAVAPTMRQADETLSPIRTSITRARGPYFKLLTAGSLQNTTGDRNLRQKLVATKKGVENFVTGSLLEIRPMSINKLQGLNTKYNTLDEWLSGDTRENVINPIAQGAAKQENWVIIAISSEGVVRNGAGDDIKMELMRILKGEFNDPHTSIWHFKLDDESEVNGDPFFWLKANPNIGLTVPWDVYEMEVQRAAQSPSQKNDIYAKRFGLPMEGYSFFFTWEQIQPHMRRPRAFNGMQCAMGADLSRGDDFCAFTFLFPLADGSYGVRTRSYISENTLKKLPGSMRIKYQEFMDEGSLIVMDTDKSRVVLDMEEIFWDLIDHISECGYQVDAFGYDPYNADKFIELWKQRFSEWGLVKVIQGARTESVPLGELRTLAQERMLIFDEVLMMFTMGHAITWVDSNGNRKLSKNRNEEKVDNVAAMMDAYVAFKAHKEAF